MKDCLKILIIDDAVFFARNLAEFLRRSLKVEVQVATNTDTVLQAVQDIRFDLIISDLDLDGTDQECHIAKIRQLIPDAPIIIVSSMTSPNIPELEKLNLSAFYEKPFDVNDLKAYIEQKFHLTTINTTH